MPAKPGAYVPVPHVARRRRPRAPAAGGHPEPEGQRRPNRRPVRPRPEGANRARSRSASPPGPLRLFKAGLGDQAAWFLPYALVGLLAFALLLIPALLARVRGVSAQEPPHGAARPAPGGTAGAGRLVRGRGGRAERVQGDRPPLLRLRAGPGCGSDGGRGGVRVREARRGSAADPRDRAGAAGDRRHDRGADRAHAPAALHGVVHPLPDRRGRAQLGRARASRRLAALRPRRSASWCCSPPRPPTPARAGWPRSRAPSRWRGRATTPAKADMASQRARSASTKP